MDTEEKDTVWITRIAEFTAGVKRHVSVIYSASVLISEYQWFHYSGNNYQSRDQNFQFFGTSVTDSSGNYSFRTVRSGLYTGRIRPIHFKIKLSGSTLVTSQLMFEEDRSQFTSDMVAAMSPSGFGPVALKPAR